MLSNKIVLTILCILLRDELRPWAKIPKAVPNLVIFAATLLKYWSSDKFCGIKIVINNFKMKGHCSFISSNSSFHSNVFKLVKSFVIRTLTTPYFLFFRYSHSFETLFNVLSSKHFLVSALSNKQSIRAFRELRIS